MMKANRVYFTIIWAFVCYLNTVDADVDCQAPPRPIPLHLCCNLPKPTNDEITEQCAEFLGPPHPMPPMSRGPPHKRPGMSGGPGPEMYLHRHSLHFHGLHTPPPCAAECLFNKTGIFDENGDLNEEKFGSLIDAEMKDDEDMAEILKESFATCSEKLSQVGAEIKEHTKKRMESDGNGANAGMSFCSPFAAMVWGCITIETFENCPASAWEDSVECNANRDFLKECAGKKPVEV